MFRILARAIQVSGGGAPASPAPGDPVFRRHPHQLSRFLEEQFAESSTRAWRYPSGLPALGPPLNAASGGVLSTPPLLRSALPIGFRVDGDDCAPLPWEHLIYAYLIESTGVMDILGEVVRRFALGETLESPTDPDATAWLRATEELFYREPPLFSAVALTSRLRPESCVERRRAYWRLFALDLPHPPPCVGGAPVTGEPWKQLTGPVNGRFREIWVELLRQVWLGITNARNNIGANPTDVGYVAYLCRSLADMAEVRRRGGMLAREEFAYVATMAWFHLTVETDTAIVRALRAETEGGHPADRLRRIGERVGMAPSPASRELFELADRMAVRLRLIDRRVFDTAPAAQLLFDTTVPANPIPAAMNDIIDRWQSATGDPIKQLAVTMNTGSVGSMRPGAATAQPVRLPEPSPNPVQLSGAPAGGHWAASVPAGANGNGAGQGTAR